MSAHADYKCMSTVPLLFQVVFISYMGNSTQWFTVIPLVFLSRLILVYFLQWVKVSFLADLIAGHNLLKIQTDDQHDSAIKK